MLLEQFKSMEAYQRELVRSSVKTLAALQDQTQSVIRISLESTPYLPDAGKAVVRQLAKDLKARSDFFGKAMTDTCDQYAALLSAWE